jgi:hypothetical protein
MSDRNKKRDAKLKEQKKRKNRRLLSKQNKKKMEARWIEGKPRAFYPLLEDQGSPMEIWIGDAVNLCTRCKENKIFTNTIVIVVDILTEIKVRVRMTGGTFLDPEVDRIRLDHRICSANHLFKRIPPKPFKF